MAGRPRTRATGVDSMMDEILSALEVIKSKLPNGEIQIIQEKISSIETSQEQIHEELRSLKKQMMDPEDGLVVRVNKNTHFRKRKEVEEKEFSKLIDEHKELMSWKSTITKIVWIMVSSIAGIIAMMMTGKLK